MAGSGQRNSSCYRQARTGLCEILSYYSKQHTIFKMYELVSLEFALNIFRQSDYKWLNPRKRRKGLAIGGRGGGGRHSRESALHRAATGTVFGSFPSFPVFIFGLPFARPEVCLFFPSALVGQSVSQLNPEYN